MSKKVLDELKKVNENLEYQSKLLESLLDLFQSKKEKEIPPQILQMVKKVRENLSSNPVFTSNPKNLELFDSLVNIE